MTMSEPSPQSDWLQTELESMSSQEAFPAKTSVLQGREQVLKASVVDSGQSAPVLLGSFDPDTQSLRTSQTCLMENGEIGLSEYSETFPRSGMMQNGTVYQLPRLAPTITEIGYGLWPTPRAQEAKHAAPTEWEMTTDHAGTKDSLRVQVNKRPFWPTPTAMTGGEGIAPSHLDGSHGWSLGAAAKDSLSQEPVRMWPKPTSRDYKGGYRTESLIRQDGKSRAMDLLPNAVLDGKGTETVTGQLNPMWVEWLMGFPLDHTDLNA